ncbi:MAG: hypothetical protein ACREC0_10545 [Methylocella sp.]
MRPDHNGAMEGVLVFANATPRRRIRDPATTKKVEFVFKTTPGARLGDAKELSEEAFRRFSLVHTKLGRNKRDPEGCWRILEPMVRAGEAIPVFYAGDLNNTEAKNFAFGLTRLFKIPHRFSVGDVIERQGAHRLMREGANRFEPDFIEALFGFVHEARDLGHHESQVSDALKGRVAFSGAYIKTAEGQKPIETEVIDTVMMTPRASFAPFYLKGDIARDNFKDWSDGDARIAGRKRYLPRFATEESAGALAIIRERLAQQIKALPQEAQGNKDVRTQLRFLRDEGDHELCFTSHIKLHSVAPEEIGLLLFVLTHGGDPSKPYRHLIGRAKPFGAGQLRVVSARLALEANLPERARLPEPEANETPGGGLGRLLSCARQRQGQFQSQALPQSIRGPYEAYGDLSGCGRGEASGIS